MYIYLVEFALLATQVAPSTSHSTMILTTELEFNLVIHDMNEYYNASSDEELIMYHVKTMYEKTCFQNQFIYELLSVIKHSQAEVVNKDLEAKIRIFAVVSARVIKYDELDIVTNMKVSQIIKKGKIREVDMMECKNDHCIALMILDEKIKMSGTDEYPFKIGDTISIKVGKASYTIGKRAITIAAYPFVPYINREIVFCIQPLEQTDRDYLNQNVIPIYKSLLAKKQDAEQDPEIKKRIQFFEALLYPFKKDKRKSVKASDVKDVLSLSQSGLVSTCPEYAATDLKLRVYTSAQDATIINDHAINVYQKVILDAVKEISVVLDMANTYKDPQIFESHKYLFETYENNKLD